MATILIADDRATNRQFLVTLLGYLGHRLLEASDGVEALELMDSENPDLLIVDIVMPRMDGIEFVRELRRKSRFNPSAVIFYTATYRVADARPIVMDLGIQRLLQKPATPEEIIATVNEALDEVGFKESVSRKVSRSSEFNPAAISHESLHVKLAAIIELTFDLEIDSDPDSIVQTACRAARTIVDASYAGLGLVKPDGTGFRHFAFDSDTDRVYLAVPDVDEAILSRTLDSGNITRLTAGNRDDAELIASAAELFSGDPEQLQSVIVVPIRASSEVTGCLYVINDVNRSMLSDEDQRIVETLAGFVAIVYERVLAREHEAHLTEELKRSNRELEQFASVVAHDLKSPIRSLHGFCEILEHSAGGNMDEQGTQAMQFIRESSEQLQRCIDDILTFARIRGDGELPVAQLNLNHILDTVRKNLAAQISESKAIVTSEQLPEVLGNTTQLTQVLQNLIDNAIKYRSSESPRIHVSCRENRSEYVCFVDDNGIGIPPKHRKRVFELFKRLRNDDEQTGRGLGLAICKKLVELSGGRIWVDPGPDGGSRFTFTIPKSES